jgi:acetyl esterase/lipase
VLVLLAVAGGAFVPGVAAARQPPVLSYGTDPLQTVAAWTAPAAGAPVVVLVHGGGFRSSAGDARKLSLDATQLANDGFAVFDVNYRSDSATQTAFPNEVADVVAGTQWAVAHAATYNGDPTDVNLIGGSAGGTLVGDAAEAMPGQIHSVASLSGTNDLGAALTYWESVAGPTGSLHVKNITRALGCSTKTCTAAIEAPWSPARSVTPADCPARWLVLNENAEEQPVAQADALTAALQAAGCTVTETILTGSKHAYDYWASVRTTIELEIRS